MKLIYFFDAYCGWCYGFGDLLAPFVEEHPELQVEILSGGLFTGERAKAIGEFNHIANANNQINDLYGVPFGREYRHLLEEGSFIVNSIHSAIATQVLLPYVENTKRVRFVHDLQKKFYVDGLSLSDLSTYDDLIEVYSIPALAKEEMAAHWQDETYALPTLKKVYDMGITSYPTVVIEKEGQYYDLRGNALSVNGLEKNYQAILNA